jgi:hypothetical protein
VKLTTHLHLAVFKNERSYTATADICLHGMDKENLPFSDNHTVLNKITINVSVIQYFIRQYGQYARFFD